MGSSLSHRRAAASTLVFAKPLTHPHGSKPLALGCQGNWGSHQGPPWKPDAPSARDSLGGECGVSTAPSGTPPPFPCHYQSSSRDAQDPLQPVQVSPRWDQSCPAQHSTQNTWLAASQQAPLSPICRLHDLEQHSPSTTPQLLLWHIPNPQSYGTFSSCTSVFRHNQNHSRNDVQG